MERENNELWGKSIREKIKDDLDLIIASGGVLLGIFIICMSQIYGLSQQDVGGTILIASALYLLLRKRFLKASETVDFKPTTNFIYLNNILFFLALSLCVWLLYITLYHRPVIYFVLVAVVCTSIALEILYSNNKKKDGLILIKILLIGITLYGGIYYEFNEIYGNDTHAHNAIVSSYIETGHNLPEIYGFSILDVEGIIGQKYYVPEVLKYENSYYYFPIFHVIAASTSILTSMNVYDSIFLSVTFLYVFSVIFVFLIGKKLINTKVGLIAALMLVVGDYRILFGAAPIPNTLGIVFVTIILYLLIVNTPKPLHKRFITFALFIILLLTHTLSSFVLLFLLISIFLWDKVNRYLSNIQGDKLALFWSTVIVFFVLLLDYWMYAFQCHTCRSFFDQSIYSLYTALSYQSEFVGVTRITYPNYNITNFDYLLLLLDNLGYFIFLGFGIVGTYMWLRNKDGFKMPLCITMVFMFAVVYGFPMFKVYTMLPERWWSFIYILLSLVFAYALFKLSNLINKKFRMLIVIAIIFLTCLLMVASSHSNKDSLIFYPKSVVGIAYKSSELNGMKTIHQIFNKDHPQQYIIPRFYGQKTIYQIFNGTYSALSPNIIFPDYNFSDDEGKLYVIAKNAFKIPMLHTKLYIKKYKHYVLNDEFKIRLEANSNEIYDNGEIWGYAIK